MKYKCKTCEGTYNDTCDDGLQYYHACPEILEKEGKYVAYADARNENVGKKLEGKGREELTEANI